jgi:predicted acylesterase/phospholipase RssA
MTPSVICSHRCREYFPCTACEAARATSAAPTFFSKQQIGAHTFIDGGLGYNNPSWAAYDHYNNRNKTYHNNISWHRARMINLGTGTSSHTHPAPPRPQTFLSTLLTPHPLTLLRETATNSEAEAAKMRAFALNADFEYHRFSADTGVCWIKMDEYERLCEIEALTDEYLARSDVAEELEVCAVKIAREFVGRNEDVDGVDV